MARTSSFPLYDEFKFDGKLGELIRGWKAEGKTVDDIAFILRAEHEVPVSRSTVGRWVAHAMQDAA